MKKLISLMLAAVLLLGGMAGALTASAAGTMSATASAASVTVGGTASLTIKYSGGTEGIGAVDAVVEYDPKVLQYTSATGTGFTPNGGAGKLILSYFAQDLTAPTTATVTIKFKALAAGSGGLKVTTDGFYNDDGKSLGSPKAEPKLSVTNPTLSGNANLKSLKPSSGTLTPAFQAGTTSYTVTVPYTTSSLSLSATAAESGAKVTVSGDNKLAVGKNTRVITVTAPNGTVKKYTVVITRSADEKTSGNSSTVTTQPDTSTDEDPLEVAVNGVTMTVVDAQPDVTLPDGFAWDSATVNGMVVSAAVNERTEMVLLYLKDKAADTAAFYIYDAEKGRFEPFRSLPVAGGAYILRDMPADIDAPVGTLPIEVTIGELTVNGYFYEDVAQKDFAVVYAIAPNGNAGLYVYDVTDGSMQRYREVSVPVEVPQQPEKEQPANAFIAFVTANRQVILLCSAAAGGLALLIGAVTLIVVVSRRPSKKKCKH